MKKLPSTKFTFENSAEHNGVFLLENHNTPPFIRPVKNWKAIGYTNQAPYPGSSNGFAVMLEKVTPSAPEHECYSKPNLEFEEGTQIWQHLMEDYIKALSTSIQIEV